MYPLTLPLSHAGERETEEKDKDETLKQACPELVSGFS